MEKENVNERKHRISKKKEKEKRKKRKKGKEKKESLEVERGNLQQPFPSFAPFTFLCIRRRFCVYT